MAGRLATLSHGVEDVLRTWGRDQRRADGNGWRRRAPRLCMLSSQSTDSMSGSGLIPLALMWFDSRARNESEEEPRG
jgi:hypothetical protein